MSRWLRMVIWPVVLIAIILVALWLLQRRLIYLPAHNVPPVERVLPGWMEETIVTDDGLELSSWFSLPPRDAPVVVVFPGNAGNRADRAPLGRRLAAEGLGVLLFDYRGYGDNPGRPTEAGLASDAKAAASFVAARAPGHPLVYYGESLGAAVAIGLALTEQPAALVLRSPFTSLVDVAAVHYPLLPVGVLLWDRYPSDERIGTVQTPVLVILGSKDSIVPAAQSQAIYDLANQPKDLLVIDGADHNDLELLSGPRLVETVVRFITETTSR